MDKIINDLISIDNSAKSIINVVESRKENLDDLIEERLKKGKDLIDSKYDTKLRFKENEYGEKFEKEKEKIQFNLNQKLNELDERYNNEKDLRIREMLQKSGLTI